MDLLQQNGSDRAQTYALRCQGLCLGMPQISRLVQHPFRFRCLYGIDSLVIQPIQGKACVRVVLPCRMS